MNPRIQKKQLSGYSDDVNEVKYFYFVRAFDSIGVS